MCCESDYIDITGIRLVPGNNGDSCPGNGEHLDDNGKVIECCCDECNFYLECYPGYYKNGEYIILKT